MELFLHYVFNARNVLCEKWELGFSGQIELSVPLSHLGPLGHLVHF